MPTQNTLTPFQFRAVLSLLIVISSCLIFVFKGVEFLPGQQTDSEFCQQDIGPFMSRGGHTEDMLWRGCLVASQTQEYFARFTRPNRWLATKTPIENRSCIDCHNGQDAMDFAHLWTRFPRFNPQTGQVEDLAQAIAHEIELRYHGTRPVRSDVLISTLYFYAYSQAKKQGLTFAVEQTDDLQPTDQLWTQWAASPECEAIFEQYGRPRGANAAYVVKGCNAVTQPIDSFSPSLKIWRSDMTCQSCHRQAGNLPNAGSLPQAAVMAPIMVTRLNKPIRFNMRVRMCTARSLNWLDIGADAQILSYIRLYANWLAQKQSLTIGTLYPGRGTPVLHDADGRGASILAGEKVYRQYCLACHGKSGWGGMGKVYQGRQPPPLAGPYSFNGSASMAGRFRLAGFVHANMPPGATRENPILTVQQALDVGAYLASLSRPVDYIVTDQITTAANYLWLKSIYHLFSEQNDQELAP